ncbi:MAG: quinone-dependent dihydroorotate dehydrogenase [Bacteriovoracaceae bacterium]|nr:quinone-dependent dihydroorotate dehydrogenase [Bacteriovoracaceae bacterium]
MFSFYNGFKKFAFALDPETAHHQSINLLKRFPLVFSEIFGNEEIDNKYEVQVGHCKWGFPVGLAAGLDKNAEAIDYFTRINFGAVEVGTVTPLPQEGNPRPRLFRYVKEESLRNMMGFNNAGSEIIQKNVIDSNRNNKTLGINLGKNKTTPQEQAKDDYFKLYSAFSDYADYLVINLSSPNTPGLRDLQQKDTLLEILNELDDLRLKSPCPLYLKIAPDLSFEDIPGIVDVVKEKQLEGIIATNTTIMPDKGPGGISGKLLQEKSRIVRSKVLECVKESPEIQVIGVGGVSSFDDLWSFWKAGGKVMQLYTSFIYQGPGVLDSIKHGIDHIMRTNQVDSVSEIISSIDKIENTFSS